MEVLFARYLDGSNSQRQGVHREMKSEEPETNFQPETKVNQRWLSQKPTRPTDGEGNIQNERPVKVIMVGMIGKGA